MPELPEVEHSRRLIERVGAGQSIERAWCARDEIVFAGRRDVSRKLRGRTIVGVHRHGKYFWLELDRGPHPVFHLGMTGAIRHRGDDPLKLASSPNVPDRSWPPKFTKIRLYLSNGDELVMTNARRLGRVLLRDDPQGEAPIAKLGFDPLVAMPSFTEFAKILDRRRRAVLKGLLLDQKFAAGVGNWIADEVLYQAKIDPRRRVESLTLPEQKALHRTLRRIIATAVKADARKDAFPRSWLFHRRWGRDPNAKTTRGERIEHITLAGRTTAWVPKRQK